MNDKYVTFTLVELKGIVNELAIRMMIPIDIENTDQDANKRNVFSAIYNDGIRCFADALAEQIDEEAEKQE